MKEVLLRHGQGRRKAALFFRLASAGCFTSAVALFVVAVSNPHSLARLLRAPVAVFGIATAALFVLWCGCGLYFAMQARLTHFLGTPEERAAKKRAFEERVARAEESLGIR